MTTKNFPKLFRKGDSELINFRYEIKVQGGISVAMTLRKSYTPFAR